MVEPRQSDERNMGTPCRAVFLDRDGVVNQGVVRDGKPYPPQTVRELRLLPKVEEAVGKLKKHGFSVIVVTNQPDVRTGVQRLEVVEEMHRKLMEWLPLDAIKVCCHTDDDGCDCRKPKAGMILAAANEYGIDLSASFMVGDRWRDIAAGNRAGCHSFFVDYGYDERRPEGDYETVSGLPDAVDKIVESSFPNGG